MLEERPPKRLCSEQVRKMIENCADSEEYGILSDDGDKSYSGSSSDSESSDSSSESDLARSGARGKGALPSTVNKGKKVFFSNFFITFRVL